MTILIWILWAAFAYGLLMAVGFIWKPQYPIALIGFVRGPLRLENARGNEWYPTRDRFLFFYRGRTVGNFERGPGGFDHYAITHIQYYSRIGCYLAFPCCFYFWWQLEFQDVTLNPNRVNDTKIPTLRVPGTESGLYFRLPGWRWQGSDGGYIFTKGQAGTHFD